MTLTDPTAERRAERLFATHSAALLRYARRRDPSIADDVVAEVFATAWRRLEDIPRDAEFAWLRGTADHVMRNHWRSRRRASALVDAIAPTVSEATDPAELPVVGDALGALDDRDRQLLTMTGWEGLTAPEAAARLGISAGTARNGLVRARRELAAHLAAAGIVVACAIAAFLFVRSAPDRRVVARTAAAIDRARTIRQALEVRVPGASTSTAASVEDDRARDRRTVHLPGGIDAIAAGDDRLRVSAGAGLTAAQRARAQRRFRGELAALDAAAPARVARLLAAAPGGSARSLQFAGRAARAVTGTVPLSGRSWQVEVVVDAAEPRLLRARVRRSASFDWTTIAVRGWELRGVLPSAAPLPPASTATPAVSAGRRPQRRSAAPLAKVSAPASSSAPTVRAQTNARRLAAATREAGYTPLTPYPGRTGAILHLRTAEAPVVPGVTLLGRQELWVELGHGLRIRQVRATRLGDRRRRTDTQWSPDAYIAVGGGARPVLSMRCLDPGEVGASDWARRTIDVVNSARRQLTRYAPGPTIAGAATVTVPGIAWTSSDYPATLFLSATSGEVLGVDEGAGVQRIVTWEVIPAGGPSDPLEPRIPANVSAVGPRRC